MFDGSIIFGQFLNQNEYSLCEILPFGNDNLNSYEKFLTTERKDVSRQRDKNIDR